MLALPIALAAIQLGAQYLKGRKEKEYEKQMEKAQEEADRRAENAKKRAAIASAIGYHDPTYQRRVKTPEAPDLSNYDLFGGLAGLGSTYASQGLNNEVPKNDSIDDILAQYPMGLRKRFNPYG